MRGGLLGALFRGLRFATPCCLLLRHGFFYMGFFMGFFGVGFFGGFFWVFVLGFWVFMMGFPLIPILAGQKGRW
jgi:hypothetical protein